MKNILCICVVLLLLLSLSACAPEEEKTPEAQNPTVVRTFEESQNGDDYTWVTYYEMSDGTWKIDSHTYKYCLELEGDFAKITVLSNRENISYNEAFMNLGFSSLSTDYFSPEEAVIARVEYNNVA